MNTKGMSAFELHEKLVNKEIGAVELTRTYMGQISGVESSVGAFMTVTEGRAWEQAKAVDDAISRGEAISPVAGIPLGLKDNLCTKGIRTTCSSKILENFIPPYDATVVARLDKEKAVFMGKLNMDEFAMGSSTENSAYHTTKNPWDLERVPGGSSGGSAASVAAGEVVWSLGSDTGGSIRQPASYCGIVGMKPSYGLVSRFGLVAFASSLDQIGPLTRNVKDNAILLQAIAGHDPMDSTSANLPVPDYVNALTDEVKGLKVGIVTELIGEGTQPEVKEAILAAAKKLESLGAIVGEASLPRARYGIETYYIIAPAEASANLARFDGVRYGYRSPKGHDLTTMYMHTRDEGFGPEVKRRIMLGTYSLSSGYYDAYYKKAQQVRRLIAEDFNKAYEQFDILLSPTAPTTAFRFGEKSKDPLSMYLSDICTIPVNMAGTPAISIPCGFDGQGMPIGLQLMGKAFDESILYRAAYAYEQATDWHKKQPNL